MQFRLINSARRAIKALSPSLSSLWDWKMWFAHYELKIILNVHHQNHWCPDIGLISPKGP
jgi:hypothetical protein